MANVIFGDPITITISIFSPNPPLQATGIVVLVANEDTVSTQHITNGSTSFTVNSGDLGIGTFNFVAFYAGDANFAPGESSTLVYNVVSPITTSVVVASNANPAAFGQAITFTATITAGQPITAGTVSLYDTLSPSPIGFASNITQTSTGGTATFVISTLNVAVSPPYSIFAVYNAGGAFLTSTSPTITQTISKIVPSVVVSANINPSYFNNPINLTATVSGPSSIPLGTVIFFDSSSSISEPIPLSGGVGVLSVSGLAGGDHSITAQYTSTDTVYNNATSSVYTEVINAGVTATALVSSSNPVSHTSSVTFTATCTSASSGTPAGFVQFQNGVSLLGSPALLNGGGVASITTTLLAGTYNITAVYLGTADYASSTSNTVVQVVT